MNTTPTRIERSKPARGTTLRRVLAGTTAALALVALSACSSMDNQQQRALSGGALGAAGGAAIGLMTGSWVTGAVIGGAGGAAAGALTSDKDVKLD